MAKKTITITLYMSELIYDVYDKTYLTGRSRLDGTNHEKVANMQANDDDENSNQIVRSIGNAFANLKTKLSEYIEETGTTSDNKLLDKKSNLTLSLLMPSNFNQAVNDTISAALHQYLVHSAVAEWFTITNKGDAEDYVNLAVANLTELREAINKRMRPMRPTV